MEKLCNDLLLTEPESLVKKLFLPNDLEYQTLNEFLQPSDLEELWCDIGEP